MKKITLTLLGLLFFVGFASSQFSETFETGMPASASSSETTAALASGTWKLNGVFGKSDNGSNRAAMNTSGYMVTPAIDKPTSLSFTHRGSGSGKVITVYKSIDNGANWTSIGTATVSSSSTYAQANMAVGEAGTKGVLIKFLCGSATIYVDNVTITTSNMGDEPTQQAGITATEVTGSSMKINFSKGNGAGRLLVYSKGTAVTWLPVDGTAYLNLPKLLDTNVTAAYAGNDDHVVINGLEAGETYHLAVFEYNGTNDNTNYLTSTVGRVSQLTSQVPSITINPSVINFGSVKNGTFTKRSFTVSAKYLLPAEGNITLTASSDFQISATPSSGFSTSLTLPYSSGTLVIDTIYVQFSPIELKQYAGAVSLSGGSASAQIQVLGTGSNTNAKVYYIAPTGSDSGEGTFDSPWYNLQKAVDVLVPGDTIICRGGTYYPNMMKDGTKTTVRLTAIGTPSKHLTIINFPGEFPIMNFKDQPKKVSVRGVQLDGSYWHIKGIHFTQAGDNAIKLEGNHNIVEKCTFSYNNDTGIQLGFGHAFSDSGFGSSNDGTHCAYNDIIDCDSYLNCDADNFGSDADGFACKMHNGIGNRFIRCRAWDNGDDGWDLFETDYPVYIIECWAWGSGRAENFGWVQASGSFQGNGNGIKLGGNGTGGSSKGKHEVWNSVAFNCNKTGSVKGFDQNSHGDGEKLVNCLAFGCGYDFMFEIDGAKCEFYNNVCFGNIEIATGNTNSNNAMLSTSAKAWGNVTRGFGASDYVSLSEDDAKAPRGADGSMPTRFARLKSGSVLTDKGLLLNLPYTAEFPWLKQAVYGSGRDLGPYELQEGQINTGLQVIMNRDAKLNLSVSPNPCVNETIVKFSTDNPNRVAIDICNLSGQIVAEVYEGQADSGVEYYIPASVSSLSNGVYLCRLVVGNTTRTSKMIVVR
ncbi:MAG: T9SS type A sorting domain-containing protein [Paludibacter sp.]